MPFPVPQGVPGSGGIVGAHRAHVAQLSVFHDLPRSRQRPEPRPVRSVNLEQLPHTRGWAGRSSARARHSSRMARIRSSALGPRLG